MSVKSILKNGLRSLVTIALCCLAAWSFLGKNDIGERSTFVQAMVAIVLVWVTWTTIDRSDKQIDVAQEQMKISQSQLLAMEIQTDMIKEQMVLQEVKNERESTPVLVVGIKNHHLNQEKELNLEIINLTNFPIYISSVSVDTYAAYLSFHSLELTKKTLKPVDFTTAIIISRDEVASIDALDIDTDNLGSDEILKQSFSLTGLRIDYYYGNTGDCLYTNSYDICIEAMPKTHFSERSWIVWLKPTEISYMRRDGSSEVIKQFDADGIEIDPFGIPYVDNSPVTFSDTSRETLFDT